MYIRIMILGPPGVGKTSLLRRFEGLPFNAAEAPTPSGARECTQIRRPFGDVPGTYEVYIHEGNGAHFEVSVNGHLVKVPYQADTDIYLALYDATKRETFQAMDRLVQHYKTRHRKAQLNLIVIANQMDQLYLKGYPAYANFPPPPEVEQYLAQEGALFQALSVRENAGIEQLLALIQDVTPLLKPNDYVRAHLTLPKEAAAVGLC